MSYTSSEYNGSYAHPTHEYSHEGNYYQGSQFGPPLKATLPDMKFPTILEQSNRFGYSALTHDGDGTNYYNVASAYGNSCDPKYYVAECPSNKFARPFSPNLMEAPSCNVENQLIVEGFMSPMEQQIKMLQIHFYYSLKCKHSQTAYKDLSNMLGDKFHSLFMLHDIDSENNLKVMTSLGGFATPFFYSMTTGKTVTGFAKIEELLSALAGPVISTHTPETYMHHQTTPGHVMHRQTPSHAHRKLPTMLPTMSPLVQKIKDLKLELFVMQGCHYCDKLKKLLQDNHVLAHVKVTPSSQMSKDQLSAIRGFPFIKSHTTGKTHTGYADLKTLIDKLH